MRAFPLVVVFCLSPQDPPEQRFDRPERILPHEFTQVRGFRELSDGRALISDRLDEKLVVADFTAGTVKVIGRTGAGPAEYRMPGGVHFWPGDSSLVFDEGNARLFIVGPDLKIHRSFSAQRAGTPYTIYPRGVDRAGRIYFEMPAWAVGPPGRAAGRFCDGGATRLSAPTGLRPVARIRGSRPLPPGPKMRPSIPFVSFAPEDVWQVTPDGVLGIARSKDYHVEWVGSGPVRAGRPVPFRTERVTRADKIEQARRFTANASIGGKGSGANAPRRQARLRPACSPIPLSTKMADHDAFAETLPPFAARVPRISPEGVMWVERAQHAGQPTRFDLFDQTGNRVGRAVLPAGRRLLGLGRGTLYLVATDEFGDRAGRTVSEVAWVLSSGGSGSVWCCACALCHCASRGGPGTGGGDIARGAGDGGGARSQCRPGAGKSPECRHRCSRRQEPVSALAERRQHWRQLVQRGPQRYVNHHNQLMDGNTKSQTLTFGLSSDVDLFTGFRRGGDVKAANAREEAAGASLDESVSRSALETAGDFFSALAEPRAGRGAAAERGPRPAAALDRGRQVPDPLGQCRGLAPRGGAARRGAAQPGIGRGVARALRGVSRAAARIHGPDRGDR